jgi:hypothetical protein
MQIKCDFCDNNHYLFTFENIFNKCLIKTTNVQNLNQHTLHSVQIPNLFKNLLFSPISNDAVAYFLLTNFDYLRPVWKENTS